jgi:hypothetical protein
MLAATTRVSDGTVVGEGTSHHYRCTLAEEDGSPIQLAAITAVRGWLDDESSGNTINGRLNDLFNQNGGSVVDGATLTPPETGKAVFFWRFTPADAVIVSSSLAVGQREWHRITLQFTYTKTGGGTGQLTKQVHYPVQSFARI